jgi:hypothetical protein
MSTTDGAAPAARKLKSWKEIAVYFGADERTVKRWETSRALPVHRVPGGTRTPVYAFSDELEAWLKHDTRKAPPPLAPPRRIVRWPAPLLHKENAQQLLVAGFVAGALFAWLAALAVQLI